MGIAWANIYIMGSFFLILQPVEHVWSPKGDSVTLSSLMSFVSWVSAIKE